MTECGAVRSCPHHSANVQIRAPLIAMWRLDSSAADLAMFAWAVSILAIGVVVGSAVVPRLIPLEQLHRARLAAYGMGMSATFSSFCT